MDLFARNVGKNLVRPLPVGLNEKDAVAVTSGDLVGEPWTGRAGTRWT